MMCDNGVTVTRDIRVTSQVRRHVTSGVTKRVSHATTTTPHHTTPVLGLGFASGVFEIALHASLQSVRGRILATQTRPMDATTGIRGGL